MLNELATIENKIYNYDDIYEITVNQLLDIKNITYLPLNLMSLNIENSIIENINFSLSQQIYVIRIVNSNLDVLPDITSCINLTSLHVSRSKITHISNVCVFSKFITQVNLSDNLLSNEESLLLLPKNIPILLFNNYFHKKRTIEGYNLVYGSQKNNWIQQHQKTVKPNTNYDLHLITITQICNETLNETVPRQPPVVQQLFNSSQTVHINSICCSVEKSIKIIKNLTNEEFNTNFTQKYIDELINEFYVCNMWDMFLNYLTTPPLKIIMKNHIKEWCVYSTKYKDDITYEELLSRVWLIVKKHALKKEFIQNIKLELVESINVCFVGKINRLVNSLIGFVDGITVGISVFEQIQLEIGCIMSKLTKKEQTFDESKKQILELFNNSDNKLISEEYKQAWIDALNEFKLDNNINILT
jgi:hypothetical protein